MIGYTAEQILDYLGTPPNVSGLSDAVKQAWVNTLKNAKFGDKTRKSQTYNALVALGVSPGEAIIDSGVNEEGDGSDKEKPSTGIVGNSTASAIHTPDEIIKEANDFVGQGTAVPINGENLKGASSTLYNLLLSIGIFLSVAIGVYLGVKFMLSTAEDKAKVKEALIPYIVGCVVIFSAFIIWKLAIELLSGIS